MLLFSTWIGKSGTGLYVWGDSFFFFIVIQLQLCAFSPHPSTPPQPNPPPSPTSTLPLDLVHVSFKVVPVIPSVRRFLTIEKAVWFLRPFICLKHFPICWLLLRITYHKALLFIFGYDNCCRDDRCTDECIDRLMAKWGTKFWWW